MPEWLIPVGAALLLVLVASFPARLSGNAAAALATALVTFSGAVFAIRQGLEHAGFVEAATGRRVVRYANRELKRALKRKAKNIVVVDGGSGTARALDPKTFRRQLKKQGYDASIVQVSLAGANHFERFAMHHWLLDLIRGREREEWKATNTILLSEVHDGYDKTPLVQLADNTDTDRAYSYLYPSNAFWAWKASRLEDGRVDRFDEGFEWTLLRHVLYTGLNVGTVSRLVPYAELKPKSGFSPKRRAAKKFRFKGVKRQLGWLKESPAPSEVKWLQTVREPRLREAYRGLVDNWSYHTLPRLRKTPLQYNRATCSHKEEPCLEVDRALLKRLNHQSMWHDRGHLARAGAKIYSKWLADQLIAQWLLKR
jgi:hypothetical protein